MIIFFAQMKLYKILLFGLFGLCQIKQTYAQNLCDDLSFEKGGFSISESSICLPKLVTLSNTSGVQNPRYVFDYQGESLETVKAIALNQSSKNFNTFTRQPVISTVLQIGEKSGKTTIACQNIALRPNNSPIYSYSACPPPPYTLGNTTPPTLGINIPNHTLNDFDSYKIIIGSNVFNITKADLPYQKIQTVVFPLDVTVEGKYTDLSKSCVNPSPTIPLNVTFAVPSPITSQFYPAIKKIELTSKTNAAISFNGPFINPTSPDDAYNLYAYKYPYQGPISASVPAATYLKSGEVFNFPIPDSSSTYCFFVERKNNICGSLPERSAEMCTNPLNAVTFQPFKYDLEWNRYPDRLFNENNRFPDNYVLSRQKIKRIEASQTLKDLDPTRLTDIKYSDVDIDCKKKYCYRLVQDVSGAYNGILFSAQSISNQICKDRTEIIAEKLSDAWVSTRLDNINEIKFNNRPNWPIPVEKFYLYKVKNGILDKYDSLDKSLNLFIDKTKASKSETYSIGYIDICNSKSAWVNNFSSVFLEKNASDRIVWTKESPFLIDNVGGYEVEYINETSDAVIETVVEDKSTNTHKVIFDKYDIFAKFRIKINADLTSNNYSYSNVITIPVVVSLYTPNVFTPNGDNKNDIFELSGKTSNFDFFRLKIYNNIGEKVFELKNPTETWDGNIRGKPAPVGLYSYKLSAVHKNGQVFSTFGSLDLFR